MRVGIDYRFLSAGKSAVNRGVGRYTQQQLREVVSRDQENEYLIFCHSSADQSLILPEIREARNTKVVPISYPNLANRADLSSPADQLWQSAQYQEWLFRQSIDVYHATVPFLLMDHVHLRFDACPLVTTMYDLIPLIFPSHYLPVDTRVRELYMDTLQGLHDSSRLLAISESARMDATQYMGFPRERIDLAYPIADPHFRPLALSAVQSALNSLRLRVPIPDQFIMSVSYFHHTKNLETLLVAYSFLPLSFRRSMPLVLTFMLGDAELAHLRSMTDQYGITDSVLFTGFVSDDEMVALYNAATVLVHPSRYEGFGLPVLEAMRCGTPIITTTTSSLPEVGGEAAILVHPDDAHAFADAIERIYREPERREMMRECGLRHAARFNPDQLAENTLACYRKAVHGNELAQPILRPRIALWTPLPPEHSGIADYSAELLGTLSRRADVEVFVDDGYRPATELLTHYCIQHHSAFSRRQVQQPFDVILYQFGASRFHLYMEKYLDAHPGIVVLHDLMWGLNLYADSVIQRHDLDGFKNQVRLLEGRAGLQEFERALAEAEGLSPVGYWGRLDEFFREYLMLRRVIDRSLAQIIHMDLADELQSKYEQARVYSFPMGVSDPWRGRKASTMVASRAGRGIRPSTFVVGVFGVLDPVKRVDVVIHAFSRLLDYYPDGLLLVVGGAPGETYPEELRRLVANLQLNGKVVFTGRVPEEQFGHYLLECDVIVNLRYPSRKHMSAVLMRAIAAGKPTIVTDLPEWRFLPDEFCLKVAPDDAEIADLAEKLRSLAQDPEQCEQIGRAARAYYEREASLRALVEHYLHVITEVTGHAYPAPGQS